MSILSTFSKISCKFTCYFTSSQSKHHVTCPLHPASKCLTLCTDDSCDWTKVYCWNGAECKFGAGLSADRYEEIDCIAANGERLITDSGDEVVCPFVSVIGSEEEIEEMETNEDESAKLDTLSCDDVARNEAQKLQADSGGVLLHDCKEENECANGQFSNGDYYECTGDSSCENAQFNDIGGAYCRGRESCRSSELVHGDLLCAGKSSCEYMNYGDSGDVRVECNGNVC